MLLQALELLPAASCRFVQQAATPSFSEDYYYYYYYYYS
jgi:hypothetical protein